MRSVDLTMLAPLSGGNTLDMLNTREETLTSNAKGSMVMEKSWESHGNPLVKTCKNLDERDLTSRI